jgi:Domain of unknown function (DUF5076)
MADDTVHELAVPETVHEAGEAVEVFRAFVADGNLVVTFDPMTFRGSIGEWGRLLADAAQHIAHAIALEGEASEAAALAEIVAGFEQAIAGADPATRSGHVTGKRMN